MTRFLNNRPGGDYGHAEFVLHTFVKQEKMGIIRPQGRQRHEAEAYAAASWRWRCSRCGFTTARPELHRRQSPVKCWWSRRSHYFFAYDPADELAHEFEGYVPRD